MKLRFLGADREVTGSCHCLEACGKRILIDCGLQQGQDEKDNNRLPISPDQVDLVLITHAHIDHSGRLPLLVKEGYRKQIVATSKTCQLMEIMLRDSAHIQQSEAQWRQRKGKRAGRDAAPPLYTMEDADAAIALFSPVEYHQTVPLFEGITARFVDAGHLLGSASIEITVTEGDTTQVIVFSGDIGNLDQPIIRDPEYLTKADYVVMESTYGDRNHGVVEPLKPQLARIIDTTLARGGNVIIPSFAVGRTQELLYFIREIKEQYLTPKAGNFDVYVDSPLAAAATSIYDGDLTGYADEETLAVLQAGFRPLYFPGLHICQSAEESMALNADQKPKVIISSSGMCEAGRIRHHLKHNLWRGECSVVFVGFQAAGTLGRIILEGAKEVKLFGEPISVKAQIHNLVGMSGHADHAGLLKWIHSFQGNMPRRVFVVHGEDETCQTFQHYLQSEGFPAIAPYFQSSYDLLENRCLEPGVPPEKLPAGQARLKGTPAYQELVLTAQDLARFVESCQGRPNKTLSKISAQIKQLMEEWK